MLEFAPICIYLVMSRLVSLIPFGVSFPFLPIVWPIQKNYQPTNVVPIPQMMPEVVLIYDFIRFQFYLLSLSLKSPFRLLGQYLSTRLIHLDVGPWWLFYWFWQLDLSMNGKGVPRLVLCMVLDWTFIFKLSYLLFNILICLKSMILNH